MKNCLPPSVLVSFSVVNCISIGVLEADTCGMIKEGQKENLDDNSPKEP